MKIGLLIAITRELEAFLQSGEERTEEIVAGRTVYKTRMEGHEIYAVCSGCGEIDAASATMLLIVKYGCELILNFGVTGALDRSLKVEDLFVAEKAWHYDFDITAFGAAKVGQYEEYPDEFIPLDADLISLVTEKIPGIRKISVASADKFVENREMIWILQTYIISVKRQRTSISQKQRNVCLFPSRTSPATSKDWRTATRCSCLSGNPG